MKSLIDGYREAVRLITRDIDSARNKCKASGDWTAVHVYRTLVKQRQQMKEIISYLEGYYDKKYAYGRTKLFYDYEPQRYEIRCVRADVARLSAAKGGAVETGQTCD